MSFAEFWPVLILAIAISADGFGVGITYGMRQIRIGILPLIIIGLISTLCIYISGLVGAVFGDLMNPEMANYTGSFILIARSEERRVGKECRSRRAAYHYKNT